MAERSPPKAQGQENAPRTTPSPRKREIDPGSTSPAKGKSLVTLSPNVEPDSGRHLSSQATSVLTHAAPSWHTRHLKLPFDLRDHNVKIDADVRQVLSEIFPNTVSILVGGNRIYLHFTVKELPEPPWPLTIAGLPITIGDEMGNGKDVMFPKTTTGNMSIRICEDIDARFMSFKTQAFRSLADTATRAILTCVPELAVIEFILDAERKFHVVLEDSVDVKSIWARLPGRIAKCWTMYLFEKDLCRPDMRDRKALRQKMSNAIQSIVDDTAYNVLRPGVLISSFAFDDSNRRGFYSTSSGVLVKNGADDKFMTGASHGIGKTETVHQTLSSGDQRVVGRAVAELSFTDISLIQLQPQVEFVNEAFEQQGESVPPFTTLLGEDLNDEIDMMRSVFFNSPQTGAMEGLVMAKGWKIHNRSSERTHPREAELEYVVYDWVYLGQNELPPNVSTIPNGSCGSAIWDDMGRIIGFFHHHLTEGSFKGFYASVSADEVVKAGYRLASAPSW